MSVYYDYDTGRPGSVLSNVRRRISSFTRFGKVRKFKIGITNSPERRWRQCYESVYDEMLVVYQSSSIYCVSELEYELVNHNWFHCDNIIAGGGGGIGRTPPYFLYVVVKYRRDTR
jgi:hypothetical protein